MKQLITLLAVLFSATVNAQNVGIGTTTPTKPLTIKTDGIGLNQESNTGGAKIGFYTSGTNAYLQTHNAVDLKFATNDSTFSMILKRGSGNLGIGQANPTAKLDVYGNIKADTLLPVALRMAPNAADGKVLTSDAVGNATWQKAAFSNTERFRFTLYAFNSSPNALTTLYNFGTAYTSYTAGTDYFVVIISKTGLYHFDFNASQISYNDLSATSSTPKVMTSDYRVGNNNSVYGFAPYVLEKPSLKSYAYCDKSFDIFITGTAYIYFSADKDASFNNIYSINVSGHLIAE